MNWDRWEGSWRLCKGTIKERWGKLTDDELDVIKGKREQLIGRVQRDRGIARIEAARHAMKSPNHSAS
jgi:uncharacterized protein YjbJ (UPF0337 family)